MSERSKQQGFTLLELIFAMVIAVIMLVMTSVAMRPTIEQEGPRGLAHALAADLRAARAEAIRSGRPVAFSFASDGRSNSLTRSAYLRTGDERGKIWRTVSYESEFDATIFIGKWGDSVQERFDLSSGWTTSTARETAIYFAPDGTAYSEDVYCLDGRYPLVVASAMEGDFTGPQGRLSAVRNPNTIWISRGGTVELALGEVPLGILPPASPSELNVAHLSSDRPSAGSAPRILASNFMPEQIAGLETAGIGQNFVQIHPNQKEGQQLEYGLVTIEVLAEDYDGGPLRYTLSASASAGDAGKFSVSEQEGEMSLVYDRATHRHVWKTVVSWRPPRRAPVDRTYDLSLTVSDPEGNSTVVSTEAGLLPSVTTLPPARLVVCSTDKEMYLTNLDGANEVLITRNGQEYSPFFSQDGSCVFSFHDLDSSGHRELRSRPANGSVGFSKLADFSGSTSNVEYDPTYTFVALTNPAGDFHFDWGQVTSSGSSSDSSSDSDDDEDDDDDDEPSYSFSEGETAVPVSNVWILNLMAVDPPIRVTNKGNGEFFWDANARHTFYFGEEVPLPKVMQEGFGPFAPVPGYETVRLSKYLVGFPPHMVDADVIPVSAAGRVYNPANRDWYMVIEGSTLSIRNHVTGVSQAIFTSPGGFERSDTGRVNPSWSANGQRVAFITSPGAGAKIVSMQVLDPNFTLRSPLQTDFELQTANPSRVQLSPGGEWIYFMRGGRLLRAVNTTGRPLVDITDHLGVEIADYVISP